MGGGNTYNQFVFTPKELRILDCSDNFFSGSIPPEFGQLGKLQRLLLQDNVHATLGWVEFMLL